MLLKDFYILQSLDKVTDSAYIAFISLNPAHEIFKAHFPGNPVTPGVCMMQIIKEIIQHIINGPLTMISADNAKFTALINPELNPDLKLELEITESADGVVKVKNTTFFEETVALKMSCTYIRK